MTTHRTGCCIAGGGPAGLMLGYLLARAGIEVTVLEKHADFLRDFRGDTIHPSTLAVLSALGDLDDFLKLPHHRFERMEFGIEDRVIPVADFATIPGSIGPGSIGPGGIGPGGIGFVAMMPQWDFLSFLAGRAARYPGFDLRMRSKATGLIEADGRVAGITVEGPQGAYAIRADLIVGADGRGSLLRDASGLPVRSFGAPIDVLWFRLARREGDSGQSLGRMKAGRIFVMLNRGDYWQIAHVVAKGTAEAIRAEGLDAFRARVSEGLGLAPGRADEITSWDQVKLLNVQVNRLRRWWREGLLFIGDAAHAMSPLGGVGINLAVQDAVAAANLLAAPLAAGPPDAAALASVEARRLWPTRVTQRAQVIARNRVIRPAMAAGAAARAPWPFRLFAAWPWLRRFPARFIGLGIRPETPSAAIVEGRGQALAGAQEPR